MTDSGVAVILKAVDQMSPVLDQIARNTAALRTSMGNSLDGVAKSADTAGNAAQGLGTKLNAALAGAVGGATFAAVNSLTNLLKSGLSSAMSFVGDAAIGLNARLEQARIGFTTMLGSGQKAQAFLDELATFAAKTPFEFPELVTASQRLLAFGFEAERIIPLMTSIGDASAALGAGSVGIDRMVSAIGQMSTKTRVQTEELLQLQEIGVPALQLLADALDLTVAETQKLVTQGKVNAETFIAAFQEFATVNYGDMMEQQSRTFSGAMATIQDSLNMAIAKGAEPLFERLSALSIRIAEFTSSDDFDRWVARFAIGIERIFATSGWLSEIGGSFASAFAPLKELGPLVSLTTGIVVGGTQLMAGQFLMLAANVIGAARTLSEGIGILYDIGLVLTKQQTMQEAGESIANHIIGIGQGWIDAGKMSQQGTMMMLDAFVTGKEVTEGLNSLFNDLAQGKRYLRVADVDAAVAVNEYTQAVANQAVVTETSSAALAYQLQQIESYPDQLRQHAQYWDDIGRAQETATHAAEGWAATQAASQLGIDHASAGMQAWKNDLSEVEQAIDILQQRQEDGIISDAELARLEFLSGTALPRVQGGIADVGIAYTEQVEIQERLRQAQDAYNQALADGSPEAEALQKQIYELAGQLDPMAGMTMDWVESNDRLVSGMKDVIADLRQVYIDAGLIEGLDPTVAVDSDLQAWRDAMAEVEGKVLQDKHQTITVETREWVTKYSELEAAELTPKVGDFGADISDFQIKFDEAEAARIADKTVNILGSDTDYMQVHEVVDGLQFADKTQVILGDNGVAIQAVNQVNNLSVPDKTFTITPYVDLSQFDYAIQYIDDRTPHSPAKYGPLSKEPNWQWIFGGIGEAARAAFAEAEDAADLWKTHMQQFELWDFAFGNFAAILTGDKIAELTDQVVMLSAMLGAAIESNAPQEIVDGIQSALDAAQQQINAAMALAGTEAGQAFADAVAAEQAGKANLDWWMKTTVPMVDQVIRDGDLDRWEQAVVDAQRRLDFAAAMGASDAVIKQLEQDLAVAENNLKVAGTILGMAVREGWIESIEPMTDDAVAQILAMIDAMNDAVSGSGDEFAVGLVDEIFDGIMAGRVTLEQAFQILPKAAIPALEDLEKALTVDLAEAIIAGADNVPYLLEQLEMLRDVIDGVRDAAKDAAVAIGTFVPGRGYYYGPGTYTTGDPTGGPTGSGNILERAAAGGAGAQMSANRAEVTVNLDNRTLFNAHSESFTNRHTMTATMGSAGVPS